MSLKGYARKTLLHFGFDIQRRNPEDLGFDPFQDMQRLTRAPENAVLFDIGANVGQTIRSFRKHFKDPTIYAFEPSPSTFERLREQAGGIPNVHLVKAAMGAKVENKVLIENTISTLTSLLPPAEDCWGEIAGQSNVDVNCIDSYCARAGITRIDVLKSDTQGFDFEVLSGSAEMLRQHRIHLVYVEMNFCNLYVGMAHFEKIYLFLREMGLVPVAFYNQAIRNSVLGWADGLFVDLKYDGASSGVSSLPA